MRLTKDMFSSNIELFGIRQGQMCIDPKLAHNGSWYNQLGEKMGWGDLSIHDARRIITELEDGEVFAIVGEYDSYWNLRRILPNHPDYLAPGVDFVVEHLRYALVKGEVILPLDRDLDPNKARQFSTLYALPARGLSRQDIKKLIFKK